MLILVDEHGALAMTRADAWIHFAAVALGKVEDRLTPIGPIGVATYAATDADQMLAEFDKRFVSKFGTLANPLGIDSGLFFEREKKV